MLISEAFDRYRRDVIIYKNQSKRSEQLNETTKKCLISHFGDIPIEDLTFEHVRQWKEYLSIKCADNTVRGYIIKLRVVLVYMYKLGVKVTDPDLIPVPQRGQIVPKFITPDDVTKLINSSSRIRTKAVIAMMYASGIRISELCSLNRGQIQDGCFTIIGKGRKARLCFIDERAKRLTEKYLTTRHDNNPALFISQTGKRISATNIQLAVKLAAKNAGLESMGITPHVLRHSYATNLLRNNTNMRYVQVLLGHSSLETTQMYSHVVDMDLQGIYKEKHTI